MDGFLGAAARWAWKHVVASADLAGSSWVHALEKENNWASPWLAIGVDLNSPWTVSALFLVHLARSIVPLDRHSAREVDKSDYRCDWFGVSCISSWGFRDQMRDSREPLVSCGAWCNRLLLWSMWISHSSKKTTTSGTQLRLEELKALLAAEKFWQWHKFDNDRYWDLHRCTGHRRRVAELQFHLTASDLWFPAGAHGS
jgi:hypothetical protein